MKILWISFFGSWTKPLLEQISCDLHCKVGIIVPSFSDRYNKKEENGVNIYYVPVDEKSVHKNMSRNLFSAFKKTIDSFNPHIIHIHGTEKNLAQIQNYVPDIPIVISIQGIMMAYKQYAFNYLERNDYIRHLTLKNILGIGGVDLMYRKFKKATEYECDIFNKGKYFIGRTDWDQAQVLFRNPKAHYFKGEELLRNDFYENANKWEYSNCRKRSIFMPAGFNPIKGLHLAIDVVFLLKKYFPDIRLIVPGMPMHIINRSLFRNRIIGETYVAFLKKKILKYGVSENIIFLERLDSSEMVREMLKANVFLSPSSIDNSPNAVGEASMIGLPIVVTPVGGIPSFLKDGESCLYAPAGDSYLMALQIKRIFEDSDLAENLSANAFKIAKKRHCVKETTKIYIDIYSKIITMHKNIENENCSYIS